jgi:filamentous hemagglutinin family protein
LRSDNAPKAFVRTRRRALSSVTAALISGAIASIGLLPDSNAQVTSSGLGTIVNQPSPGVFDITGGARPSSGPNLFHSFGEFSPGTGQSANFLNGSPALTTSNILSRVTGGNPSNIFGTIDTTAFPGANLFLMNPSGIVFGPNAQLNVAGSFHATTADYIKLGSDGIFFANDAAGANVLTASAPSAFGFLNNNPASIEVRTGGVDLDTFIPTVLQVPEGGTLSLVGGNAPGSGTPGVAIGALDGSTAGYVLAPAGRVNLVSVASAGEATFDGKGFNVDGFPQLGIVRIGTGPGADISNIGALSIVDAKEIFIRGGQLEISNGVIAPGYFAAGLSGLIFSSPLPDGGEVNIKVTQDVTITGTGLDALTNIAPGIFVYQGIPFEFSPEAQPPTKAPDVTITAGGSVSLFDFAGIKAERNAPGEPANVVINADTVNVFSGGSVALFNTFAGPGGNLIVNAKDVSISDGSVGAQGVVHLAFLFGSTVPELITADSGNITINASNSLNVTGLGQITTDSRVFGAAGAITINAGDILLSGTGQIDSGLIASQSNFAGDAGNVTINAARTITIKDGFRISSTSLGSGNAGNVSVMAGGSLTMSNAGRILGRTNQPPDSTLNALFFEVFGTSFDDLRTEMGNPNAAMMDVIAYLQGQGRIQIPDLDLTPGNAGIVAVNTPGLTLNAGASLETSTGWEGNAGQILANVGTLSVNGGSFISSSSGIVLRESVGTIIGPAVGPGNAGGVNLTATDAISVSGAGSIISTSTFGDGNGGNVELSAGNMVSIVNGGAVRADSGGTLAGTPLSGTGLAGNITISSGNQISLTNGQISTQALTADGGNITLLAPNLVSLQDSAVSTSVAGGLGQGGNIMIDPQFVIVNNSSIIANAFGGPGGNITIIANNFLASTTSVIEASSALSTPGVIEVRSPENNVENNIAQLPAAFIDASALLRGLCTARRTGAPSSFVVAGRGGIPVDADGYLPSFATDVAAGLASTGGPTQVDAQRVHQPVLAVALLLPNELDCLR